MSRYLVRTMARLDPREPARRNRPSREDFKRGAPWAMTPDEFVLIEPPDSPYQIEMELVSDRSGGYVVTGISIRRPVPMQPQRNPGPATEPLWPKGAKPQGVSPRDIKRMPLSAYIRTAIAARTAPYDDERPEKIGRALVPRGRPERGRSTLFYSELLDAYNKLASEGVAHPVKEIARRKRVSHNLVYQWLYRARVQRERAERSRKRRTK